MPVEVWATLSLEEPWLPSHLQKELQVLLEEVVLLRR
jgi:hypothetical protein